MVSNILSQLFRSRVGILREALISQRPADDGHEPRQSVATLYELLLESPAMLERLYRMAWEGATGGKHDPVELGTDLFGLWDDALGLLRIARPGIESAEHAGDLPLGSASRLSSLILSLQADRELAHARWPWLTPADAETAAAEHSRGETISNTELVDELQGRLAARGA